MKQELTFASPILSFASKVYYNLSVPELVETAVARKEAILTGSGALRVTTGKYTGRSPNDKFIVDVPAVHGQIAWSSNKAFDESKFERLYERMMAYIQNRDVFVFDGFAGADENNRLSVRFINEFAWQNLFVHQLFVRPDNPEHLGQPDYQVVCLPGFKADPQVDGTNSEVFIVLHFEKRLVLIGGTHYAGEMKKSIFTVMNYILPQRGILSMHCSANVGKKGDSALFFGLSGTGKTTTVGLSVMMSMAGAKKVYSILKAAAMQNALS